MTMTGTSAEVADVEAQLARLFTFDEDLIRDPFPLYAKARELAPVTRIGSIVVVTRYDDVKAIFRDPHTFSNIRSRGTRVTDRRASLSGEELERYNYLIRNDLRHIGQQDEPEHMRLRRFVNEAFSGTRVNAMRDAVVELAEDLLDGIEADGKTPFDLARYSYRLPLIFMTRLLGIPDVEVETFRSWALDLRVGLGTNYENLDAAYTATKNIEKWVREHLAERRAGAAGSTQDLMGQFATKEIDGTYLTDDELVTLFTVMLTTGNTNDMISNAVIELDRHPEQKALLLEDPSLFRNAVEEFFRYSPAVHSVHRVAARDCEINGFQVREGETIRLMVASANHDAEQFPEPEVLDIRRPDARQHLDLGFGIHVCLGQWISRLEVEVALSVLYRRFPNLRVAGPVRHRRNYAFHGVDQLLVDPQW